MKYFDHQAASLIISQRRILRKHLIKENTKDKYHRLWGYTRTFTVVFEQVHIAFSKNTSCSLLISLIPQPEHMSFD